MKLREWMFRKEKKISDLAREINVNRSQLNQIVLGKRKPNPQLAAKIEKATNGEVTLRELLFPEEYKE